LFTPFPIYYRADIIEELGLTIPTTIDEFTDFLRAIHSAKPDMVTLTTNELFSEWYFQNVYNAFGYNHGWMPDPNDPSRIVPSNTTKTFRDALEWLHLLRVEGLIDPDHMIAAGKRGADTFKAGNAVVICINWNSYLDLLTNLRKTVPEASIGLITSLKGPGGVSGADNASGYDRGFSINIRSANKADDIFRYLNWVYTDGYEINRYGFEGKTFTRDADGNYINIPNDQREPGFTQSNREPLSFPNRSADQTPNWLTYYNEYIQAGLTVEDVDLIRFAFEDSVQNYSANYDRQAYSKTMAEKGTQLEEEYLVPARNKIMIDPTADITLWDEAVKNWLAAGGQQIIDEINEAQKDKSKPIYTYEYTGPDYR
jgi:putative aldouronate transport system substrate-binding protein